MKVPGMFLTDKERIDNKTEQLREGPKVTEDTDNKEWFVNEIIREYNKLKEEVKPDQKKLEDLKKQIDQKFEDFHSAHNKDSLDAEIEAYLQEKGFRRVRRLNFFQDIFGSYKRNLMKNPTYISDNGYFFRINKSTKDPELHYELGKQIKIKSTYNLISTIDRQIDLGYAFTYVVSAITIGTAIALFNTASFGGIALVGTGFGSIAWLAYKGVKRTKKEKNINMLPKGTYEPIEELIKIFGDKK